MSAIQDIKSDEEFEAVLKRSGLVVVHFYADWAAECQPMNEVLEALSKDDELKGIVFGKIAAEDHPKISVLHKISAVPTFLFFLGGKVIDRLDGANAAKLSLMVKNNNGKAKIVDASTIPVISPDIKPATSAPSSAKKEKLDDRLKRLINQSHIMLFMKGVPENPQCGFSRQAIALLKEHGAQFGSFDIFSDEEVRQGLKTYSNWPTYPQLYVGGELVGGLDIMKEMAESGDLAALIAKKEAEKAPAESLNERLKKLVNKSPLMIFVKGDRDVPRCGFSRQLIDILNATNVPYETFDILGDEEVRQGLKTFSNWPTYPQVYVKGELVGGLDIIKEMKESGELLSTIQSQ